MSGWDSPPADPDDWFSDERRRAATATQSGDDDWLDEEPGPLNWGRRAGGGGLDVNWLWVAIGGAVLLVLLIVGLAVAGVFSSSKSNDTTPPVTQPITTAQTTTTAPAAKPPAPPTTTLKPGDTGEQVKALQRSLNYLKYTVGKVDGDYGTKTTEAVKKFQTAQKLTADGILGPKSLAALTTALQG